MCEFTSETDSVGMLRVHMCRLHVHAFMRETEV